MTTLEIVLALFQSVFFIIAGSLINSQNESDYRFKMEMLEKKKKTQVIKPEDIPKRSYGGLIVFYCGIFGLFATLAVLIFFY